MMATSTAKRPHRLIFVLWHNRRAQVALQNVPFECLLRAFDAIPEIERAELVGHLPDNFEYADLGPDGPIFDRLTYCELVSHDQPFFARWYHVTEGDVIVFPTFRAP
jgi:hypothetical protein